MSPKQTEIKTDYQVKFVNSIYCHERIIETYKEQKSKRKLNNQVKLGMNKKHISMGYRSTKTSKGFNEISHLYPPVFWKKICLGCLFSYSHFNDFVRINLSQLFKYCVMSFERFTEKLQIHAWGSTPQEII